MKKVFKREMFLILLAILLAGCSSTTITEYNADGTIKSVTESNESALSLLARSATDKDNFFHASGWAIGVQPSAGIYGAGAFDALAGSINEEHGAVNATSYAAMVNASKVSLDITASAEGLTANSKTENSNETTSNNNKSSASTEAK